MKQAPNGVKLAKRLLVAKFTLKTAFPSSMFRYRREEKIVSERQ